MFLSLNYLEQELGSELQYAGQVSSTNLQEAGSREGSGWACPFIMVKDVEGFGTEFERHVLLDGEVLE